MKRIVVSLFALLGLGLVASAQTEKGNWLVGGNITLNTAKQNTQVAINPSAGYFFMNNIAAGINANVSHAKFGGNKTTTLGVGPFARYYFGTMNIRPLLEASLDFNSNKVETSATGSASTTENGTGYFLGGGLAAFINRNVAIEGLAGYDRTSVNGGSGGFNLRIGFQVYLSRAQVENIKSGGL
ncbi:MAG TPA: outer membrane beta-barrel protein [Chitinophagaceae bacterium]|jgi:hypothetical protein|nr:outer membrane beta-barrel protein [Chitinophagaceae bacterium]